MNPASKQSHGRLRPCEAEAWDAEAEHLRKNALGVGPQRQ